MVPHGPLGLVLIILGEACDGGLGLGVKDSGGEWKRGPLKGYKLYKWPTVLGDNIFKRSLKKNHLDFGKKVIPKASSTICSDEDGFF